MSLYVPAAFGAVDRCAAVRLMHDHAFATLITPHGDEPLLTHLPLVHIADCEPHGSLLGHFARANPHASNVDARESIAVFQGPHAYVSPSWYGAPAEMVPTWNYAVVHAHGVIELAREPAETRAILDGSKLARQRRRRGCKQKNSAREPTRRRLRRKRTQGFRSAS